MNPTVSIILPVYNAEKYIRKTIQSVLSQTYDNWELIAVNDGSTDGSLNILEFFSSRDPRIKVYNQSNQGRSAARNLGISQASGVWLCFMDADDLMTNISIETMLYFASEKTDIIIGSYRSITAISNDLESSYKQNKNKEAPDDLKPHIIEYAGIDLVRLVLNSERYSKEIQLPTSKEYKQNIRSVWGKLYKAELIKNNDIFFQKNLIFGEDVLFNSIVYYHTQKIKLLSTCTYLYNESSEGTTRKHSDNDSVYIINFAEQATACLTDYTIEQKITTEDINQFIFAEFMRFFFRAAHYSKDLNSSANIIESTFWFGVICAASRTYTAANKLVNIYYHFLIFCFKHNMTFMALILARLVARIIDGKK